MNANRKKLLSMLTYIQNRNTHIDILSFTVFLTDAELVETVRSYAAKLSHDDQMNLLAIARG